MRDLKLQTLMIFVPDLPTAKDFYRDTLGFHLVSEDEDQLVFSFSNGSLVAYRCQKSSDIGDYANEARSVFVFGVTGLDATVNEMRGKGVRFLHEEPAQNEWGRYAAFVDPFGNVHELFEEDAS